MTTFPTSDRAPAIPGDPADAGYAAPFAPVPIGIAPDAVWAQIRREATEDAAAEPALAAHLQVAVLRQPSLEEALTHVLSTKLHSTALSEWALRDLIGEAFRLNPQISEQIRADLVAIVSRDPACRGYSAPLLYFKGFHAVQAYRVTHAFWTNGRRPLALFLQSRISEAFAVDIHPGARIGKGIMFDHATSVVIGETAVVEDDFSMLHEVTLGGTGKVGGDRHPKIGRGVMIGAGAKVLGNVKVGEGAKIGAGSVVLHDVPSHTTVAGVPARPINFPAHSFPALEMDQSLDILSEDFGLEFEAHPERFALDPDEEG